MSAVFLVAAAVAAASIFDDCARTLGDDTRGRTAATCVRAAAERSGSWPEAARWLEAAAARDPTSGWLLLQLAEIREQLGSADSIDTYVAALERFGAHADPAGEAEARVSLGVALYSAGRPDEAWREVPHALAAARRSDEPPTLARALIYEAWLAQQTGQQLGRALRALHEAEALVFPSGPYAQQIRLLVGFGNVSLDLGRYEVAEAYYSRALDLARDRGDAAIAAFAASNVLVARRKQMEMRPDRSQLPEFTEEARRLVRLADDARLPVLQAVAHRALGDLLASSPATWNDAAAHYENAVRYAREANDRNETTTALWALGRYLVDTRPAESRRLIDEALEMAVTSGSGTAMAYAWRQQMRLAWKTQPPDAAVAASLDALDAIERLRALQGADLERASVFGAWTLDYHWLIGQLLAAATPSRERVELAFHVAERMRARVLLDTLERPRVPDAPASDRRLQLLQSISALQTRLLDPHLRAGARQQTLAELERLEREEAAARAAAVSGVSTVDADDLVTLDAVEQSLAPHEAALSFVVGVGTDFYGQAGGGAWLLVVTRDGTEVVTLPDRTSLEPALSVFRGAVERAASVDDRMAAAMYKALLDKALAALPPTITRLIVIADGALHHLPFAALQPREGGPPVGVTHEIAVVPSATIWQRLRSAASTLEGGALVLADPVTPDAEARTRTAREREWSLRAVDLGRLRYSGVEGRAILSRVGGDSRLLTGVAATETAVKAPSGDFAILHFATHALVDEAHPERSAVVLTGGDGEDGLLQAREIAELPLDGRIVVLSACRSATGAVLGGEGVVGLSRAFFAAGARTVVGTLWSIRDDHAAHFTDAFYAALGEGRTVGDALREARRRAIAAGMPASAWASYVVIGDDSVIPVPAPPPAWSATPILVIVAVLLGGWLGAVIVPRRAAAVR